MLLKLKKGRKLSKEHVENIRKARIGNQNRCKKLYQYTLDGRLIKVWKSAVETKLGRSNIAACCNGRRKTYKGFRWSYVPL